MNKKEDLLTFLLVNCIHYRGVASLISNCTTFILSSALAGGSTYTRHADSIVKKFEQRMGYVC